jgi:hypothetical protein
VASTFSLKLGYALGLVPLLIGMVAFLPELLVERPFFLRARSLGLSPSAYLAAKLAALFPLTLLQMVVYQAITYPALGLKAPFFVVSVVLALTATIGLLVALLIATWPGPLLPLAVVLSVVWAVMILALPAMQGPEPVRSVARLTSSLTPVRWAYEALLVLEADRRPTWIPPAEATAMESDRGSETGPSQPLEPIDMAEPSFHAATERMGPTADILALTTILLTLLGWGYALLRAPFAVGRAGTFAPSVPRLTQTPATQ